MGQLDFPITFSFSKENIFPHVLTVFTGLVLKMGSGAYIGAHLACEINFMILMVAVLDLGF